MKSSEAKKKEPAHPAAKASRATQPVAPPRKDGARIQVEQPRTQTPTPTSTPRPAATDGTLPVPDLTKYGVNERDAREHVARCEPCGRAHKHILKNPKDVMALDSFGRHVATCIAVQGEKARA